MVGLLGHGQINFLTGGDRVAGASDPRDRCAAPEGLRLFSADRCAASPHEQPEQSNGEKRGMLGDFLEIVFTAETMMK